MGGRFEETLARYRKGNELMFPGHFAAGLALKAAEPQSSTIGIMIGVGLLDIVYGVLVPLNIEGGGFAHFVTPWSHSLLTSLALSGLYAGLFWRKGPRVAAIMFAAVFSHWVLDLVSHQPDMALWPYSKVELGFGSLFGGLGGWFELLITLGCTTFYAVKARRASSYGRRWPVVCLLMLAMYVAERLVVAHR